MMTRRSLLTLLARGLCASALLAPLSIPSLALAQPPARPLTVVATTGMLADAVGQVGGDRVQVSALMGTGVDPHTYRQIRSDVARLTRADLIIWHGLNLEAQLEKLLNDLARRKRVAALAESIPADRLLADDTQPAFRDPHVWMDPELWQIVVLAARDVLTAADPEGRATYEANAARYAAEVRAMGQRTRELLHTVPEGSRVLVTAHDAFRYFGRAYGYEVLGIQGISTESEASLHRMEELVRILVERKIGAIFVESSVSDQHIRALVEGAAARGHTLRIGGELYSDAMGEPGTPAGTYLGMIEHNARTIAEALKAGG